MLEFSIWADHATSLATKIMVIWEEYTTNNLLDDHNP